MSWMNRLIFSGLVLLLVLMTGCTGIPEGIEPVTGFDVHQYMGRWYEIVRLDHSFERGMERVYADYRLKEDGSVEVLNNGYDPEAEKWKQAEGKAVFVENPTVGRLKVSFFGPFYGAYNIIALGKMDRKDYAYAMVCGPDRSYLWILSRTRGLDAAVLARLVDQAGRLGFDTDALIYVMHE